MADELLNKARRICCRLCLAPENECVPIFTSTAADKEPIAFKINACVSIKVEISDSLSSKICHACISYLNSWQSFKNRCLVAQKKQKIWMDMLISKENNRIRQQQQHNQLQSSGVSPQSGKDNGPNINGTLDNADNIESMLLDPKVVIKEEPIDLPSDDELMEKEEDIDPAQFLATSNDVDPYHTDSSIRESTDGPPILTSLGLTHINSVNPFSFLSTELGHDSTMAELDSSAGPMPGVIPEQPRAQPKCSICHMKFSNRANARRHERNIHGKASTHGQLAQQKQLLNSSISQLKPNQPITSSSSKPKKQVQPPIDPNIYNNPENYRELLTDAKIQFIRRNLDFLEQYQHLRCKCCNKEYPSYKFFMAHMRKKYHNLARNLCFKCLKQFQTKAQFIAHLKRKNCINLYRLYNADDTIPKNLGSDEVGQLKERQSAKEMLTNKMYGCKMCTKTFRLKMDFRGHVYEAHADQQKRDAPSSLCPFCNVDFGDSQVRRRHYNNMECILFIICGTCDGRFENNTNFITHVYETHMLTAADQNGVEDVPLDDSNLESISGIKLECENLSPSATLRQPQNCTVCGKQYNNYYNVLRHMESKHPDQLPATYRCELCNIGYPRQTELREHMLTRHGGEMPIKVKKPDAISCRFCVGLSCDTKEDWVNHQATVHKEFGCNHCIYTTTNQIEFEAHLNTHEKKYTCEICEHSFQSIKSLTTHVQVVHEMKADGSENVAGSSHSASGLFMDDGYDEDLDDDDGFDDGNDADNDETMDPAAKRRKLMASPNVSTIRECKLCHAVFNNSVGLANHMRSHPSGSKITLNTLNASNTIKQSSQSLLQPNRGDAAATPSVSRLRCHICKKRIYTKAGYEQHMQEVHQVNTLEFKKCELCPAEFSNNKGLKVHIYRAHRQQEEMKSSMMDSSNTSLSDLIAAKTFGSMLHECDICLTVYHTDEQLRVHKSLMHNTSSESFKNSTIKLDSDFDNSSMDQMELLFQCRFCAATFNARKKLTLHMNNHTEYDPSDNTCKDCGNVYRSRKSLWVHRHKKHPMKPDPSPCDLCDKIFYDKSELYIHLKNHSDEDALPLLQQLQIQIEQQQVTKTEELNCHICHQQFFDKRVLSKHLRIHEMDNSYNSSQLVAMLDTGDDDSVQEAAHMPYQKQLVNGEYACDICPKSFPLLTALKVHRGWHFRGPDGRQVTDPDNMWQPGVGPPSRARRLRNPMRPPICPYCNSKFASTNNLRRHIIEVHKRNEARLQKTGEQLVTEKENECKQCNKSFNSRLEWVEHKVQHVKTMKPSATFEWICDICAKVFTRKERLLAHMISHVSKEDQDHVENGNVQDDGGVDIGFDSNSQSTVSSSQRNIDELKDGNGINQEFNNKVNMIDDDDEEDFEGVEDDDDDEDDVIEDGVEDEEDDVDEDGIDNNEVQEIDDDDDEDDDEDDGDDDDDAEIIEDNDQPGEMRQNYRQYVEDLDEDEEMDDAEEADDDVHEVEDDDDDDVEIIEDDEDYDDESNDGSNAEESNALKSCDLCQVFFKTEKELRLHITSHIFNTPMPPTSATGTGDTPLKKSPSVQQNSNTTVSTGVVSFKCKLCGSAFDSQQKMLNCLDDHRKGTNNKCTDCNVFFSNDNQLNDHKKLCHSTTNA